MGLARLCPSHIEKANSATCPVPPRAGGCCLALSFRRTVVLCCTVKATKSGDFTYSTNKDMGRSWIYEYLWALSKHSTSQTRKSSNFFCWSQSPFMKATSIVVRSPWFSPASPSNTAMTAIAMTSPWCYNDPKRAAVTAMTGHQKNTIDIQHHVTLCYITLRP